MTENPDRQWIEESVKSLRALEPQDYGPNYVAPRRSWALKKALDEPSERLPGLIVSLFDFYESQQEDAFSELMWLIEALYAALPRKIGKDDACSILAATRHSCGHGGVEEPVELAEIAFEDESFTPEFFSALRTYRARLNGIYSAEVTRTLGKISLLLWQDPNEPLRPRKCLSSGIRKGFFKLRGERQEKWSQLFRHLDRTGRRKPDRKWTGGAYLSLQELGEESFAEDLREWLQFPEGQVALSTGGRHVIKTLTWFAALGDTDALDDVLPRLIDLSYAKPKAAVHLIYATGFWLGTRPAEFANPHLDRLREKWPIAGKRI